MDDGGGPAVAVLGAAARLVVTALLAMVVVPPVAVAVAAGTLLYAPLPAAELPDERPQVRAEPSVVLDGDGNQIGVFRGFDRTVEVEPDEVPSVVGDAVVAIEDQRFWAHDGVDLEGIARAARTNLEVGAVAQGGSTITQQYVKNVYLSNEQTIERKLTEALLAIELEERMSKEEILFGYLTTSYFGDGAYGIGAAAEVYFAKPVADLDISEAATLAGLVQAPTRLSPRNDLDAAEQRRRLVLQAMADQGYLSAADHEREAARQLWLVDGDRSRPAGPVTVVAARPAKGASDHPYFVDWVESQMLDQFGPDLVYRGGLVIETTIDPRLQAIAERTVARQLEDTEYPVEMSLVSIDPSTGHVVAMVGGRDHAFSQVNLATGGSTGFQPGSSFKPLVLAAAFERGIGPETTYPAPARWEVPGCSGPCTISNYDFADRGSITLREAMRLSVNTVFAQLVLDVGIDATVDLARRLGLEHLDPDGAYGPSLALGAAESSTLEMASAYGTFANRGVRVGPTGVARVTDADGNVLVDNRRPQGTRVVSEATADHVTDVLVDVVENGTGTRARLDRPAAGKTGTTQEYRAAWFVGYTPQLSTAVWMGHADRLASLRNVNGVRSVTGGSHPAVVWQAFTDAALAGVERAEFPEPAELEERFDTAAEVSEELAKRTTRAGPADVPRDLRPNCGGRACEQWAVPAVPALPPPQVPTTTEPISVLPFDPEATTTTTVPGDRPATTVPTTTASPTTAPTTTTPATTGTTTDGPDPSTVPGPTDSE